MNLRCLSYILTCLLCTCAPPPRAQISTVPPPSVGELSAGLQRVRESSLTTRRFKQPDLAPLIRALPPAFAVDTAGRSMEDRPLWRVRWGEGETDVLLWSQMHGDEPTATAALFDVFNWLGASGDGQDSLRDLLGRELTLTFLPMLNPDGAARYQRRNALGIDLNRDALRLTSPEAQLLKAERDRLDADWGFNLHDQSTYYSAGFPSDSGSVLSILAPAYDWEKGINAKREDAMQLIALVNDYWQSEVPGQIGRYNDDFEPRAFGDNLQKWGTRTILIESGGLADDPEKQRIRHLNAVALLIGLHGIATERYENFSRTDYERIPQNKYDGMHELILENGYFRRRQGDTTVDYRMDVGFRFRERSTAPDYRKFTRTAYVSDLGDLHTFGAFERIDLEGGYFTLEKGELAPGEEAELVLYTKDGRRRGVVRGGRLVH